MLTRPRNLPTPGRRQPLYVVLRLRRDLCFWVNSRLGHFTATLSRSRPHGSVTVPGYLFFRSYEAILPSSLERVISRALVYSTNPPVAVYGTDTIESGLRSFSWQCGIGDFSPLGPPSHASLINARADFPTRTCYTL